MYAALAGQWTNVATFHAFLAQEITSTIGSKFLEILWGANVLCLLWMSLAYDRPFRANTILFSQLSHDFLPDAVLRLVHQIGVAYDIHTILGTRQ